jgi:hypothetical protein
MFLRVILYFNNPVAISSKKIVSMRGIRRYSAVPSMQMNAFTLVSKLKIQDSRITERYKEAQ